MASAFGFATDKVIAKPECNIGYAKCLKKASCPVTGYKDLDVNAWYHDGVHFCLENGYMDGTSKGVFEPNKKITRAQLITILWRIAGSPVSNCYLGYNDVSNNSEEWYVDALRWATGEKIISGDNGYFYPKKPITREQFAVILYRFSKEKAETKTLNFTDSELIHEYAKEAVSWCYEKGIITGDENKALNPQGSATRTQAAVMIQRLCEYGK